MLAKLNTHGVCCLYAASRSSSTTPEYNKTPDVPILQPVPIKSNASAAAGAATERTQFMLPPPKAQRVFHSSTGVVDSPTNTTIRDTLIRLYSSSSDTSDTVELPNSSDVALRLQHHTAKPLKPAAAKPTHLPLSQSQNVEISRTTASPKPPCSPKPKSPVKSPALLHPEHQSVATKRASAAPRNRIAAVAGSSGKSASFDEGDAHRKQATSRRLISSNSDSSSVNTVFTSGRGSPSAVSDISVFSAENLTYDAIIMGNDQRKSDPNKRRGVSASPQRDDAKLVKPDLKSNSLGNIPEKPSQTATALQQVKLSSEHKVNEKKQQRKSSASKATNSTDKKDPNVTADDTKNRETSRSTVDATPATADTTKAVKKERVYSDIVLNDEETTEAAVDDDPYAYAGDGECGKWSLQHIALGITAQSQRDSSSSSIRPSSQTAAEKSRKPSNSMVGSGCCTLALIMSCLKLATFTINVCRVKCMEKYISITLYSTYLCTLCCC